MGGRPPGRPPQLGTRPGVERDQPARAREQPPAVEHGRRGVLVERRRGAVEGPRPQRRAVTVPGLQGATVDLREQQARHAAVVLAGHVPALDAHLAVDADDQQLVRR
ncbi:hypothetical protein AEA42_03360, partial [Shewanella sp. Sh95]